MGLIGSHRAAPDSSPVHVDVVQDRGTEHIEPPERVLRFIEDDDDPLDGARDRDQAKVGWAGEGRAGSNTVPHQRR